MEIETAARIPPPRRRMSVLPLIEELKASQTRLIRDGSYSSIKSILSRLRRKYEGKREYTLHKEDGGVRVWRLK